MTDKPSLTEEQLWDRDADIPTNVHLGRIARELTTLRSMMTEALRYMRDAESEIPEKIRRFMNYFHDVHDIKFVYEEHGIPVPPHVHRELERLDDRYKQLLRDLWADGGTFEKVRQEMSKHDDNRWDHTKQIPHMKPKEPTNETGSSPVERDGVDEG